MSPAPSRRDFLTTAALAGTLAALPNVHAAGDDLLRVGLVGCGSRGTGASGSTGSANASPTTTITSRSTKPRTMPGVSLC